MSASSSTSGTHQGNATGGGAVHFARLPQAEDETETPHGQPDVDDTTNDNSSSPSAVNNTSTLPLRQVTTYHDDFSTSICLGLFADPYDRSSCCATVCCGTLMQDLNYHVVTGARPVPWWKRIGVAVAVIVLVPVMGAVFGGDHAGNFIFHGYLIALLAWGIYGTRRRKALRLRILRDVMGQSVTPVASAEADPSTPSPLTPDQRRLDGCGCYRPVKVHRLCSFVERDVVTSFRQVPYDDDHEARRIAQQRDFCAAVWQTLAMLCCGCCGCWWNCWGVCATAQEHRELRQKLPAERFELDYITLQPYAEYVPLLDQVRDTQDKTLWGHCNALSKLSRSILWGITAALALVTANIFLSQPSHPIFRLILVLATFGQALLVLYLVHWRHHRFDVSLDAIIKLFGAGFCFATGTAMVVELITSLLGYLVLVITLIFEVAEDDPSELPDPDDGDPNDNLHFLQGFAKRHILTFVIFSAFNAFVVASLTEETAKFFSFWMVEHPDYTPRRQRESGLHSTAAAITCGMVAVACGFACCENFLYIFGEGLSLSGELEVLFMRSCFPVHPICAAIQSVGICKRDVEHDGTKLGQAILPAILLHGVFDFWLMLLAVIAFIHAPDIPEQTLSPGYVPPEEKGASQKDLDPPSLSSLTVSFLVVAVGLVYYFWTSQQQRQRLDAMAATEDSTLSLALT